MARRMDLLNQITRQLSVLATEIALENRSNRMTLNSDVETIYCGFVNRLCGWELGNLNEEAQNFPGIDLADRKRGIAVQITASATNEKVKHTLKTFFKYNQDRQFRRLILLITTDRPIPGGACKLERPFDFEPGRDIWNVEVMKRKVEAIEDAEHLQTLADYLDSQLGLLPGPQKPEHLLPPIPAACEGFLEGSRDGELEILEQALQSGNPVFIWGLGGMGKSQTAIQLANRCAGARGAYFLRYTLPADPRNEGMEETILRTVFSGYRFNGGDETDPAILRELEYQEKMDILRREYADTVIVVDNFDWPGKDFVDIRRGDSYHDLLALTGLGVKLIFTTRYRVPSGFELGPLKEEYLVDLMRKNLCDADIAQDDLLALIRAVGGHTLMVDLLAKTLQKSRNAVRPAQILDALKEATLNIQDFPRVAGEKDGRFQQAQIYKHIQALFNLSGLPDDGKYVLALATLAEETGLDEEIFRWGLGNTDPETLEHLLDCGWLHRARGVITIHPAVAQVVRGDVALDDSGISYFLDGILDWVELDTGDAQMLGRAARCVAGGADRFQDGLKMIRYRSRALEIWEQILPEDGLELASIYGEMGLAFSRAGKNKKALRYTKHAMRIKEGILPRNHPDLAHLYQNLGGTMVFLDQFDGAIRYQRSAVEILEKTLPPMHPDLARAYYNLGVHYFKKGSAGGDRESMECALEYSQNALSIYKKILSPEHPDWLRSCAVVGEILYRMGEYRQALRYARQMVSIRRRRGSADRCELAFSLRDCGRIYEKLQQWDEARASYDEALELMRQALPGNSSQLAELEQRISLIDEKRGFM